MLDTITEAIDAFAHPLVQALDREDRAALAAAIVAALADTQAPEPTLTQVDAGPALVLTPAAVVAMVARTAITDSPSPFDDEVAEAAEAEGNRDVYTLPGSASPVEATTTATIPAAEDFREFRQFVFATQAIFGARVRSVSANQQPLWRIGATEQATMAMTTMWDTIRAAAAPVLATLATRPERTEFWATLGAEVAATDENRHLAQMRESFSQAATMMLEDHFGPVRTLPRITPVTAGHVRGAVDAVLAATT